MRMKSVLLASAMLAGLSAEGALAAGQLQGLPVMGGPQYCNAYTSSAGSTGNSGQPAGNLAAGQACTQYVPGAAPLGDASNAILLLDTGLANGAIPQTAVLPAASMYARNFVRGGDFSTNLWQRGTTPLSGASPTTVTYAADGWWGVSASNVMTVSKQTPATTATDYNGAVGFPVAMRVARPSGTPSGSSCVGGILDKAASYPFLGNNANFSFYAATGAGFSGGSIQVTVAYYTAADSATAGTNSATAALSLSGQASGITGYQAAVAAFGGATPSGASITSGVATIPLGTSQSPTLYTVSAPIPAMNASNAAVIGVVYGVCTTPTATTTISTDWFELSGVALNAGSSAASPELPNGVTARAPYERVPAADEANREYYYYWQVNEPAASKAVAMGNYQTATICDVVMNFPRAMREVPALTVGGTAESNATWAVMVASTTPVVLASTYLVADAVVGSTTYAGALQATTASKTAGQGCTLVGAGGGANIQWSAEP